VLLISIATVFLAYRFDVYYHVDLTLLSIAIIFPLVFAIRGSFRRREKALEHLSQFRSSLKTVHYFLMTNTDLTEENRKEVSDILNNISDRFMDHLISDDHGTKEIDDIINNVLEFVVDKEGLITRSLRDKVFRYMNDLHESVENLHAIHVHRTPISLNAYCRLFIYIFPLIYTPTIIFNIGLEAAHWVTYFVVLLTEFILITLYNIQNQLEYPFDNVGLDDIKLDNFRIDR
jgi:predicted membrane chloride channel (bestrophin family)